MTIPPPLESESPRPRMCRILAVLRVPLVDGVPEKGQHLHELEHVSSNSFTALLHSFVNDFCYYTPSKPRGRN